MTTPTDGACKSWYINHLQRRTIYLDIRAAIDYTGNMINANNPSVLDMFARPKSSEDVRDANAAAYELFIAQGGKITKCRPSLQGMNRAIAVRVCATRVAKSRG